MQFQVLQNINVQIHITHKLVAHIFRFPFQQGHRTGYRHPLGQIIMRRIINPDKITVLVIDRTIRPHQPGMRITLQNGLLTRTFPARIGVAHQYPRTDTFADSRIQ